MAALIAPQTPSQPAQSPLVGAWTVNTELSDARPDRGDTSGRDRGDSGGRRGGGGYGGGRGGFRGGVGGGGNRGGGGAPQTNPEGAARVRDARRAVTNPPDRLATVQSAGLVHP